MPQISIPSLLNSQEDYTYQKFPTTRSLSMSSLSSSSTLINSSDELELLSPLDITEFPSSPIKRSNISILLNNANLDPKSDYIDNSDDEYYNSTATATSTSTRAKIAPKKIMKVKKVKKSISLPLNLAKSKNYSINFNADSSSDNLLVDNKNQGRPYTNYLQARFYLHEDINHLYCYLIRKNSFKYSKVNIGAETQKLSKSKQQKEFSIINQFNKTPTCKSIIFESASIDEALNINRKLLNVFQTIKFKFIKVIRDVNGKLIKLETIDSPDVEFDCTWIKKNICYPRYKSKMKIHLIKCAEDDPEGKQIIYNDLKMFDWDFENDILDSSEMNDISIVN